MESRSLREDKKKQAISDGPSTSQMALSLRLSEARLVGILASAMDAIIAVDEDQNVVLFNAAAEKMFRCPSSDALGQSLDRFIPVRLREVHRQRRLNGQSDRQIGG